MYNVNIRNHVDMNEISTQHTNHNSQYIHYPCYGSYHFNLSCESCKVMHRGTVLCRTVVYGLVGFAVLYASTLAAYHNLYYHYY